MRHIFTPPTKKKNQKKKNHYRWLLAFAIIVPWAIISSIFTVLISILSSIVFDVPVIETQTDVSQNISFVFAMLLGTITTTYLFTKFIERKKYKVIGLSIKNRTSDIITGLIIGALCMLIGYILLISSNQINFIRIYFNAKEISISIIYFFVVALSEEILFRGYILRVLMDRFSKFHALIISALVFMLLHIFNPNLSSIAWINIFLLGISFGITYIYTNNLWLPISFHFSWNLFQTLFGFSVSGVRSYSVISTKIVSPNIFNGGEFGFEGSALAMIFIICITGGLYSLYRNDTLSTF
ncbi:CPBP family intramembrane metalloprotease [Halosquirtibacter laminarini]|uniref:CPBP family intramembrane metalloprotease n=1 Tax=Halosquirtibacter laminarini TaxID=3374600 RepID=A0AC61NQZ6_9BACT|nr:CPBP family intramembrane metalloprotease [Prolixibacteraceae bacterium]